MPWTSLRARDIADTSSTCPWNPDMYGVDMRKPGAQAYYDSVFALYASWGVDFVKMDDMSRPYDSHAPEIEAAHKAIRATGRPIALSLSPGETPVHRADHVRQFAQMWRISDDFWDEWRLLEEQFTRLENWNPHRRPGGWPDADMLPLGRLALGDRDTKFTADEQRTVMTLWSIARSPLIMGGDLRHLDAATLALLTNREVLAVNQASTDNQPHFVEDGMRVWTARPEEGGGRYLALFNLRAEEREVGVDLRWLDLPREVRVRDLWSGRDLGVMQGRVAQTLGGHGAGLYRLT
jgi:alpha-galactosidase